MGSVKRIPLIAFLVLVLTACANQQPMVSSPYPQLYSIPQNELPESAAIRQLLLSHYQGWAGVPYRFGGDNHSGIDCSAYTSRLYRDIFNQPLKRRVVDQKTQGQEIEPEEIRAGDLVFFNPHSYPHHVGVALGDGRFIHVSSKKGVMIAPLHRGYWAKHFREARRIIDYVDGTREGKEAAKEG